MFLEYVDHWSQWYSSLLCSCLQNELPIILYQHQNHCVLHWKICSLPPPLLVSIMHPVTINHLMVRIMFSFLVCAELLCESCYCGCYSPDKQTSLLNSIVSTTIYCLLKKFHIFSLKSNSCCWKLHSSLMQFMHQIAFIAVKIFIAYVILIAFFPCIASYYLFLLMACKWK